VCLVWKVTNLGVMGWGLEFEGLGLWVRVNDLGCRV